jgi:hypothetical protein
VSYREQQEKLKKQKWISEYETEQARPLENLKARIQKTHSELSIAQRTLDATALLSEPNNKALAERVKAFVPADPPLSVEELRRQIQNSLRLATDDIIAQGYKFTDNAEPKIRRVLGQNARLDFTTPEALYAIIGYMVEVGALVEGTDIVSPPAPLTNDRQQVVVRPTAESLMDEVENSETTSYEGERLAKRRTHEAMVLEIRPVVLEFFQFVESTYDIVLTEDLKQRVISYCVERGGFSTVNLNAARRDILKCRTPEEQLELAIETTNRALSDYDVRTDYARRWREIQQNKN